VSGWAKRSATVRSKRSPVPDAAPIPHRRHSHATFHFRSVSGRVDAVVLDEFHERHLETDLGAGVAARLQLTKRPICGSS